MAQEIITLEDLQKYSAVWSLLVMIKLRRHRFYTLCMLDYFKFIIP